MSDPLREQVARIQECAHKLQTEGGNPDCVIVWAGSPLGMTKATVATAGGELEVIPDALCPPGNEVVMRKSDLNPATLTHEERARAMADKQWNGPHPRKDMIASLSAAFAEVAEEARLEVDWQEMALDEGWKPPEPKAPDAA